MKEHRLKITEVLALLTLAIFAVCVLLVLLTGATVYQDLVEQGEGRYAQRTALGYLTTRVRQAESVEIGDYEGNPCLILEETVEEITFVTRIYCWDGWLWEQYAYPGAKLSRGDGERILEAQALSCGMDDKLLTMTLDQKTVSVFLPTDREVAP